MVTLKQIEFLAEFDNKSEVIRFLLDRAMSNQNFDYDLETLKEIEKQIEFIENTTKPTKWSIEERKEKLENILIRILQYPPKK